MARMGYEIYVSEDDQVALYRALLDAGQELNVRQSDRALMVTCALKRAMARGAAGRRRLGSTA